MTVSYKEARETKYWLRLLRDTNLISENMFESFVNDCEELLRIIGKIQITLKKKEEVRNS